MSAVSSVGRALWRLTPALALLAACTDTNIAGPRPATGGIVLFSSNRGGGTYQIYRVGTDGRGLTRLTDNAESNDFAPVLSPDGRRVAWEREVAEGGRPVAVELWVMDADGSDARVVVRNGSFNQSPSWTPDGRSLVYASFAGGNWEIYRVALDGSDPVNLSNNEFADQAPRVSPDGSRVIFQTNRDLNFEVYAMGIDGADPRNLSQSPADDRFPSWTPDGASVVWTRFIDSFDLWVMGADGAGQRELVATPYNESHPAVSPDGRTVVFQSDQSPPFSLYTAAMTGGAPEILVGREGRGSHLQPWWGRAAR
jgi:TolB protein